METPQPAMEDAVGAIERWQNYYHVLLETLPDAAFSQAETGVLMNANAAAAKLTGYTQQELSTLELRALFTPESYARLALLVEEALSGMDSFPAEAELMRRDGSITPVRLHATVL